ncbi:unnamed protein product [Brassica rapa]|uniref:F-box domain-containing protein n=3 Tax=Brassica TaxID=3705 RepID=A0A3P5YLE5_BRACM|nr:unnamed protein product [Brassica napus]CAG7872047.1 unnamed protein product [Brassica rapa]VDC67929.1 unnamed protein product [Brassica rapa]
MDSCDQPDIISNLPDVLLVLIISCLSFKECVQTCALSKRWRSVYLETRNVSFKETDFLSPSVDANPIRNALGRIVFVDYVRRWVIRIHDQPIDTFGISISYPETYIDLIESLIAFAVGKKVKNLVLDFSNPAWRTFHDVTLDELVVEIPQSVYELATLESLKVGACKKFDPSKLSNLGKLNTISFGWMELTDPKPLLKTSRVKSLTINDCGELYFDTIKGNMREVAVKNCDFFPNCTFNLPSVDILKYSGDLLPFEFDNMNTIISEVEFDFRVLDNNNDESNDSNTAEGGMLCHLLNNLLDYGGRSATTLTVCPFLLKMIPRSEHPHVLHPMETKHLVLKTELHPREFNGIRLLLMNCPNLETLTIDLLPPSPIATASSYADIDPETYWMQNISYECQRETLKAVAVKNFFGGSKELHIVKFFIRGCERLERVELYMPFDLDKGRKRLAYAKSEMLQRSSNRVQVVVHNS